MAKPFGVNDLFNLIQTYVVEPEPPGDDAADA